MVSVRVATTLAQFEKLSSVWNDLLEGTSSNHLFLTWEWLYPWAKHYLDDDRLFILLVYEGDRLVGIAPLYIRKETHFGLLRFRRVVFLGTGEACSPYLDVIVSDRKKGAVLTALISYLYREAGGEWDILSLSELPAESSTLDYCYRMMGEAGKVIEITDQTCYPIIRLGKEVGDFLSGISGNERYNLRRKRDRLDEAGRVTFSHVSSPNDVEKEMAAFVALHQMRWEQNGKGGCFKSERFLTFHRAISESFGRKGWLRLDFLTLDGEKIAGIYGFSYQGRYSFYLPGLNPQVVPEASPGNLLLYECVQRAIREGCAEFDLLRGAADYKLAWANFIRRTLTVRMFNKGVRAAALKLAESGKEAVKVLVR